MLKTFSGKKKKTIKKVKSAQRHIMGSLEKYKVTIKIKKEAFFERFHNSLRKVKVSKAKILLRASIALERQAPNILKFLIASTPSILGVFISYTDFLGIKDLIGGDNEIIWSYFFSVGGMFGASIAIVFTLSTFTLQRAADMYSSKYFEIYAFNKEEKWIYSTVSVFIVVFFALGFWFKSLGTHVNPETASGIFYASLLVIVLVLTLIIQYFQVIIKKANPNNALNFIYKESQKIYSKANKDVEMAYKLTKVINPKITKSMIASQTFKNYYQTIDKNIENVFEITMKFAERLESESTQTGFKIIHQMLLDFFDFRTGSLILQISPETILARQTDSDNFLAINLERLRLAGEKFINGNQISNTRLILDIFGSLAEKTSKLSFLNDAPFKENPPFGLIVGYLKELTYIASRSGNLEAIYKSSNVWKTVAKNAVNADLQMNLQSIEDYIQPLALACAVNKETNFIAENYLKIYVECLNLTIQNKTGSPLQLRRQLSLMTELMSMTAKNDSMNVADPIFDLINTVDSLIPFYVAQRSPEDKGTARTLMLEVIEELYIFLRELAEKVDVYQGVFPAAVNRLMETIFQVSKWMHERRDFNAMKNEIEEWIWRVSYLPPKFIELGKSTELNGNFYNLEGLPSTTILINRGLSHEDRIYESSINSAFQVAKYLIEKNFKESFYKSRSAALEIVKIGTLALKDGKTDLATLAKNKIEEFEGIFKEKFKPSEDMEDEVSILRKTLGWRRDINRDSFLHLGDQLLHEAVEYADISNFIEFVWNIQVTERVVPLVIPEINDGHEDSD